MADGPAACATPPPSTAYAVVHRLLRCSIPRTDAARGPAAQVAYALSRLPGGSNANVTPISRGAVVELQRGHLDHAVFLPYHSAVGRGGAFKALALEAFERSTFALTSKGGDVHLLAADAAEESVLRLLATATPEPEYWFAALQKDSPLLPHLEEAMAVGEESIRVGMNMAGAPDRSLLSISVRARTLLHIAAIQRGLAAGSGAVLPLDLLRQSLLKQMKSFNGSGAGPPKADAMDFEAMIESAGWERLTKSNCGYPFAVREVPAGHLPLTNVQYLVDEYLRIVGDVSEDDAIWTVANHLYRHDMLFVDPEGKKGADALSLQERVRQSWHPTDPGVTPGPLRLAPPRARGPRHEEDLAELKHWLSVGTTSLLPEQQLQQEDECRAITSVKVVYTGNLTMHPDAQAAVATGDAVAIATAAEGRATEVVGMVRARRTDPLRPGAETTAQSLEWVLALERGPAAKRRMVFGGHLIKPYVHPASFAYTSFADLLSGFVPGEKSARADAKHFFYVGEYSRRTASYLCAEFPDIGVFRFNRWCMGTPDAPLCASLLSSLIVFIARIKADNDRLFAYVDDFMWAVVPGADPTAVRDALTETLAGANVPENTAKYLPPSEVSERLGKEIDSVECVLRLPWKNVYKYQVHGFVVYELLKDAELTTAISKDSLDSLIGRLMWYCSCASEGRPHLGGLYTASKQMSRGGVTHGSHIAALARANLDWWTPGPRPPSGASHVPVARVGAPRWAYLFPRCVLWRRRRHAEAVLRQDAPGHNRLRAQGGLVHARFSPRGR